MVCLPVRHLEMQASTLRRDFFTSLVGAVPVADCTKPTPQSSSTISLCLSRSASAG